MDMVSIGKSTVFNISKPSTVNRFMTIVNQLIGSKPACMAVFSLLAVDQPIINYHKQLISLFLAVITSSRPAY